MDKREEESGTEERRVEEREEENGVDRGEWGRRRRRVRRGMRSVEEK